MSRLGADAIVRSAYDWRNVKYWYGADGQIATLELADWLREQYPDHWTDEYYATAIQDIDGVTRVGDCSALVSAAYRWGYHISTAEMLNLYPAYSDPEHPLNGMIAWRAGHCGIYNDGVVIAMRSLAVDWGIVEYYPDEWDTVLYDPTVEYSEHPGPGPVHGNLPVWLLKKFCERRFYGLSY